MAESHVSFLDAAGDSVVNGPVPVTPFIPGSANLFPKMTNRINEDAWELWEFDGVAADSETAVTVSFYRDARGLKQGGFHVDLNANWPDGTKWGSELYFDRSTVTADSDGDDKSGRVHGVWKSSTTGATASFTITAALSTATVQFSVPDRAVGSIELHALGSTASRTSGLPQTEDAALLRPEVYYIFPMGPATAAFDLTLSTTDEEDNTVHSRQLRGSIDDGTRGAFVRGWSALAWPRFLTEAYYVCSHVGPYDLQLIRIISPAPDRTAQTVARLYHDAKLVIAVNPAASGHLIGKEEEVVVVEKVQEAGGLAGAFRDKSTGYKITFCKSSKSPLVKKTWSFEAHHKRAWWSDYTSDQGTGKSGFVEAIVGGTEDGTRYHGLGAGGQLQLPG